MNLAQMNYNRDTGINISSDVYNLNFEEDWIEVSEYIEWLENQIS